MGLLATLGDIGTGLLTGSVNNIANGAISSFFGRNSAKQAQNFQREMYNEQKKFWYEQQEYNSPDNQVERLLEAGINPQLAIGNIQAGQIGGTPSVPSASPYQHPNFGNINDTITSLMDSITQRKSAEAQIKNQEVDAMTKEVDLQFRFLDNIVRIANLMKDTDKKDSEILLNGVTANVKELVGSSEYLKNITQAINTTTDTELKWLQYARGLQELQFLPQQQQLEYLERISSILNTQSDTELKESQTALNDAQRQTEQQRKLKLIQETNTEFFRAKGEKFVNSLNEKIENYLIQQQKADANSKTYKPWIDTGLNFMNTVIDAYGTYNHGRNAGAPRVYNKNIYPFRLR